MKKALTVLMMILAVLLPSHSAVGFNGNAWDQEIKMMTFIVNDIIYAGFSPSEVANFVPPTEFPGSIDFKLDENGDFVSDLFYIYCLASTTGPVMLRWGDTYSSSGVINTRNSLVSDVVTMSQSATPSKPGAGTLPGTPASISRYPVMKGTGGDSVEYAVYDFTTGEPVSDFGPISIKQEGKPIGGDMSSPSVPYVWCEGPYVLKVRKSGIPVDAKGEYSTTLYLQVEVQ